MVIYLEISFRVGTILQVDHIPSMFCGSCICFGFKIRSSNGACTMLVVCTCKSFKCICSTGKEGDLGNPTIREQQLLKNIKILPLMRRCRLEMICVGSLWYRRKCVAGAYSSPGAKLRCKWKYHWDLQSVEGNMNFWSICSMGHDFWKWFGLLMLDQRKYEKISCSMYNWTCDCGRKKELLHIVRGGLSAAGLKNVENWQCRLK